MGAYLRYLLQVGSLPFPYGGGTGHATTAVDGGSGGLAEAAHCDLFSRSDVALGNLDSLPILRDVRITSFPLAGAGVSIIAAQILAWSQTVNVQVRAGPVPTQFDTVAWAPASVQYSCTVTGVLVLYHGDWFHSHPVEYHFGGPDEIGEADVILGDKVWLTQTEQVDVAPAGPGLSPNQWITVCELGVEWRPATRDEIEEYVLSRLFYGM